MLCMRVGKCAQICSPPSGIGSFSAAIAAVSIGDRAKSVARCAESHRCSAALSPVKLATSKDHKHLGYCTNK